MAKFSTICLALYLLFFLTGCSPASQNPAGNLMPTSTRTSLPTYTPEPTAALSPLPLPTQTIVPSATITPTPTATLVNIEPGSKVVVPVLLYHHIDNNDSDIRYYVSPEDFRAQIEKLVSLGYTAIPVSKLVSVIKYGGKLPVRPVVITFDDGTEVYQNAFPVMKSQGMTGGLYVVANRLGIKDFLSVDEIKEMLAAGWEVGSHSMTHTDLRKTDKLSFEIYASRLTLSSALGITIQTFAYPFGSTNTFIDRKTKTYGYEAAMGLGKGYEHSTADLFYIDRLEIHHSTTMDMFVNMLPWKTP